VSNRVEIPRPKNTRKKIPEFALNCINNGTLNWHINDSHKTVQMYSGMDKIFQCIRMKPMSRKSIFQCSISRVKGCRVYRRRFLGKTFQRNWAVVSIMIFARKFPDFLTMCLATSIPQTCL
jgi:hypothetical protein